MQQRGTRGQEKKFIYIKFIPIYNESIYEPKNIEGAAHWIELINREKNKVNDFIHNKNRKHKKQ